MSGQPASLQDILFALSDLTTEVRRLSRDVSALHFLVEDRLGLRSASCAAPVASAQPSPSAPVLQVPAASSPSALAEPGSCSAPVPRAAYTSVPVPRAPLHCAPVPRASPDSTPAPWVPPSSGGSYSVVSSLPAASSAPVFRTSAQAFSSPASSGSEPVFHFPTAAAASGLGAFSPASSGLAVEPSSSPPRLPPSAQISEGARREIAVSIGLFFRRALSGGHRNPLQSRLYVVCRNASGETFDPPLLFYSFSAAERLVKVNEHLGDAVFCGFPALWEARLACAEAGLATGPRKCLTFL